MNRTRGLNPVSAKRRAELDAAGTPAFSTFRRRSYAELDVKPKARPRDTGPSPATVALVMERDRFCCGSCGRSILGGVGGVDWSVQHRRARQAGGSTAPDTNLPGNLLLLCGGALQLGYGPKTCHPRVESRRFRADEDAGFWVRQWTDGQPTDPTTIPVRHALLGRVLLLNDGTAVPTKGNTDE